MGRTDRTSLLALACMPADSDEDDIPLRRLARLRTALEEEEQHDLDQLADCEGDSDDEGDGAAALLIEVTNEDNEADRAPLLFEDGHTACDALLSDEELHQQQENADAPLSIPGAPPGWLKPTKPEGWAPPAKKTNLGEPQTAFKDIDNPGLWCRASCITTTLASSGLPEMIVGL